MKNKIAGAPVYWGGMPEEMFTALKGLDFQGKIIRPFVTHEGSGLSSIPNQLKKICEGATVTDGIAITGSTVGTARGKVENIVGSPFSATRYFEGISKKLEKSNFFLFFLLTFI